MPKPTRSVTCDGKSYTFQFWVYWCDKHGYWFYRSREGKHTLLDLAKHQRLEKVEQLPVGVPSATWDDFQIITARCPVCGDEWRQMKAPWSNRNTKIFCRNCGGEIQPDIRID